MCIFILAPTYYHDCFHFSDLASLYLYLLSIKVYETQPMLISGENVNHPQYACARSLNGRASVLK